MNLANYEPDTETLQIGKSFQVTVRGLSMDDARLLVTAHLDTLRNLAVMAERNENAFGSAAFLLELVNRAPMLCMDIIAVATDNIEYSAAARKLSIGAQIKIMQATLRLTLEDVGGPLVVKDLVESLLGRPLSPSLIPSSPSTVN